MIRADVDVDKNMAKLGKALELAVVFTLTDSANFARDDLLQQLRTKVDNSVAFTLGSRRLASAASTS